VAQIVHHAQRDHCVAQETRAKAASGPALRKESITTKTSKYALAQSTHHYLVLEGEPLDPESTDSVRKCVRAVSLTIYPTTVIPEICGIVLLVCFRAVTDEAHLYQQL
jgi:hypothetical protein